MAAGREISGGIVASGIAQQVLPGNAYRKGLAIENRSQSPMIWRSNGENPTASDGFEIPGRHYLIVPAVLVPLGPIFIYSDAAGAIYHVIEGIDDVWAASPGGLFALDLPVLNVTSVPITALPGLTGDITSVAGTNTTAITSGVIVDSDFAPVPAQTIRSNILSGAAAPTNNTLSALLDALLGNTRGGLATRGASAWSLLAPGAAGFALTAAGAGADLSWAVQPTAQRTAVRQTVQAGPNTLGAPNFIPSASASLVLPSQNIAGGTPLVLSAAQGFGAGGAVDTISALTANGSWTLGASATSYLFINAQTGAFSSSTLAPIYQPGGAAPSIVNGQFTFDYTLMIGYLGNGTTAVPTPLVCVGEAVTSASAVTSAVAYAFNGYAEGPWVNTAPAAASLTTATTNLGVNEAVGQLVVEVVTQGTAGYNTGERITVGMFDGTYMLPANVASSRNAVVFTTSTSAAYHTHVKTTGALVAIAAASTTTRSKLTHKRIF